MAAACIERGRLISDSRGRVIRTLIALLAIHLSACGGGTSYYTVGGSVSGLAGSGLVLQIDGSENLPVSANGAFSFPVNFSSGMSYAVTVLSQPSASNCVVTNGSGTIGASNVVNVTVQCSALTGFVYTIAAPPYVISGYGIQAGTGALASLGSPVPAGVLPGSLIAAPSGSYLYMSDSGSNTIAVFSVDAGTGALSPLGTPVPIGPAGSRPFTMVITPSGQFLYVNNLEGEQLVTFSVDLASGGLSEVGAPLSFGGATDPDFAVTPDSKFLYVTSYAGATPAITVYAIDATTGGLTAGATMTAPTGYRCMTVDPLGNFLFVVTSQSTPFATSAMVTPYAIDPASGALTAGGAGATINSNGAAIVIEPTGHTAYVLDSFNFMPADNHIDVLSIDPSSGVLTALGSPVQLDGQARSLTVDASGQYLVVGGSGTDDANSGWYDAVTFSISKDSASLGQLTAAGLGTHYPSGVGGAGLVAVID
jgi:6-phosphogluconolactonase